MIIDGESFTAGWTRFSPEMSAIKSNWMKLGKGSL